jgi:methyltransferase family protein
MTLKDSQSKHWAGKDLKIIQSYWDSPPATLRSKWFVEQLKLLNFQSIFEVGYFSGRNLRYIKEAMPIVEIGGLEVNVNATKFARDKLDLHGRELLCEDLHNLARQRIGRTYDIVFSSGVLIHVPPENLKAAVQNMISVAGKYVMHIESLGKNQVSAGPKHLKPTYKVSDQLQWAPDLLAIYDELGLKTEVIPLPDNCKTNGASELITVRL